jgi:phosphonoacetaldehyde hydrolase
LDVCPPAAVLKVGDTIADIDAGLNAGVWTVGVTRTGNLMGLTEAEYRALDPDEQDRRAAAAEARFLAAGAHFVLGSFADLPDLLDRWDATHSQQTMGVHP